MTDGNAIAKFVDLQLKPLREQIADLERKLADLENRPGFWRRIFGSSPVVTRADVEKIVNECLYGDEYGPREDRN